MIMLKLILFLGVAIVHSNPIHDSDSRTPPTLSLMWNSKLSMGLRLPDGRQDEICLRPADTAGGVAVPCLFEGTLHNDTTGNVAVLGCRDSNKTQVTIVSKYSNATMFNILKNNETEEIPNPYAATVMEEEEIMELDEEDDLQGRVKRSNYPIIEYDDEYPLSYSNAVLDPVPNDLVYGVELAYDDTFLIKMGNNKTAAEQYILAVMVHAQTYLLHDTLGSRIHLHIQTKPKHLQGEKLKINDLQNGKSPSMDRAKQIPSQFALIIFIHSDNSDTWMGVAIRSYGCHPNKARAIVKRRSSVQKAAMTCAHEIVHLLGPDNDEEEEIKLGLTNYTSEGLMSDSVDSDLQKEQWSTSSKRRFQRWFNNHGKMCAGDRLIEGVACSDDSNSWAPPCLCGRSLCTGKHTSCDSANGSCIGPGYSNQTELKYFEISEENKTAIFEWSVTKREIVPLQQEDDECIYRGSFKKDPSSRVLVTGCEWEDRSVQIHSVLYGDTLATSVNGSVELLQEHGNLFMNDIVENDEFLQQFHQEQLGKRIKREYVINQDFRKQFPVSNNANRNLIMPKLLNLPINIYLSPSWRSKFSGAKSKAKEILSHVKLWFLHPSLVTKINIIFADSNIFDTSADLVPTSANLKSLENFVSTPPSGYAAIVYLTATTVGSTVGRAYTTAICDKNKKKPRSINNWHDSDIHTAQTVAHEIGHNLGYFHDFDTNTPTGRNKACGPGKWNNWPDNDLMNYASNSKLKQNKWSDCSNEDFRNYFAEVTSKSGSTFCLEEITDGTCYQDDGSRLLDDYHNSNTNTPSECKSTCRGYAYAGVQYTTQCFCGNDKPPASRIRPSSECNQKCKGDSSKYCGGSWRINIYRAVLSRQQNIADLGYPDCGAGWYDVQGQGVKNDYCRWVGNCGCRGHCSFWSCALAGSNVAKSSKGQFTEPVDCVFSIWSMWSRCSVTCGGGVQSRNRRIKQEALHGGVKCEGESSQERQCAHGNCPVDCVFSIWSTWSRCSVTCGGGVQSRNRRIKQEALHGGVECEGESSQEQQCAHGNCPDGCYEKDTDYPGNDLNLNTGSNEDRRESPAECQELCTQTEGCKFFTWKQGSNECWLKTVGGYGKGHHEKGSISGPRFCVDCVFSSWSMWSGCGVTCGGGVQSRNRRIKQEALHGGVECEGESSQEQQCVHGNCPVDCVFSRWSTWSRCSVTCGGGVQSRKRRITQEALYGGVECEGESRQEQQCTHENCPVDCVFSIWSTWSSCSVTCGSGIQSRNRRITQEALYGGVECEGESRQELQFMHGNCPGLFSHPVDACLKYFNNEIITGITLEECKEKCSSATSFVCHSLEYEGSESKCLLSEESKKTQPSAYREPCYDGTHSTYLEQIFTGSCNPEYNIDYDGNDIHLRSRPYKNVNTWEQCSRKCRNHSRCYHWSWSKSSKSCWLKSSKAGRERQAGMVSGSKRCA